MGDIAFEDPYYIGLSYAKKVDFVETIYINHDDLKAKDGEEIIVLFFDFLRQNQNDNDAYISGSNFTCYADGVMLNGEEACRLDNVESPGESHLLTGTKAIFPVGFVAPNNWNELIIFYNDTCKWTITPNDVSTNDFVFKSMYNTPSNYGRPAQIGEVVYDDKYRVIYQWHETYFEEDFWDDKTIQYEIFKYTVENTSSETLTWDTFSESQFYTAYQDGYEMESGSPDYFSASGYRKCTDVDTIAPGMSANIFSSYITMREGEFRDYILSSSLYYDDYYSFYAH